MGCCGLAGLLFILRAHHREPPHPQQHPPPHPPPSLPTHSMTQRTVDSNPKHGTKKPLAWVVTLSHPANQQKLDSTRTMTHAWRASPHQTTARRNDAWPTPSCGARLVMHCKLVVARKQTTSREILLWMTPSEAPKALQASECSELLDPTGASCWIFAQR